MAGTSGGTSSGARIAAGARRAAALVAFLAPFLFAICGTDWPLRMHPDEIPAANAISPEARPDALRATDKAYVYPEGFFVLADAFRRAGGAVRALRDLAGGDSNGHRDLDEVRRTGGPGSGVYILLGRRLNAVLAGLCGLFLFLAVLEAGGGASGGLCAALLGACSPFLLEHAHYCETDVSFCAGLALSLWLLFRALRRRSFGWTVAGAAACGAAFACKYTVAPVVPFCAAVWFALAAESVRAAGSDRAARRAALRRAALAALLCALAAAAAYAVFTPTLRRDPAAWWRKFFLLYSDTHREASLREAASGTGRLATVLRAMRLHLAALGPVHAFLAAAGAAVLLRLRRRHPCGPWLLALAAAFAAFLLAFAPWLRSQEFLPVALLLGAVAGLGAGALCALAAERGRAARFAAPAAAVALCALAAAGDAFRVARLFRAEDTRLLARRWLETAAPPDVPFAAGRFATPALSGGRLATAERFGEAEEIWSGGGPGPDGPGFAYYLRQDAIPGRRLVDTATGGLLPAYAAGWTNFAAHAVPLAEWKRLPGYQPTFAQLPVRLWGVVPPDARFVRPAPFAPRATAFFMGGELYDAVRPSGFLGPLDGVRTVGRRASVRFLPPAGGQTLYAVTRHVAGHAPARVEWEGPFRPRKKEIAPGRAAWFVFEPGLFPAGFGDATARARVRMRGDDQTSLCVTTLVDDPALAAELLARGGSPDEAERLLAAAGLSGAPGEAFAAAAPSLPESFWRDFARVRCGDVTAFPGAGAADAAPGDPVPLDSEFPVLFDPGVYRVSFRLPDGADAPRVLRIGLSGAAEERVLAGAGFEPGADVRLEVRFDKPVCPRLVGLSRPSGDSSPAPLLRDFAIEWDPVFASSQGVAGF